MSTLDQFPTEATDIQDADLMNIKRGTGVNSDKKITGANIKATFATAAQGALADSASQPGHTHVQADIVDLGVVLLANGSQALTGNWTTGAFDINNTGGYITTNGIFLQDQNGIACIVDNESLFMAGGDTITSGGGIRFFGATHATLASHIYFFAPSNATKRLEWDHTNQRWDYYDNTISTDGLVYIKERAAAGADRADYGQLWVKSTTPNELWFTADDGTDYQVNLSGSGGFTYQLEDLTNDNYGIGENVFDALTPSAPQGQRNIGIGKNAGTNNTIGEGSIFIGYEVGKEITLGSLNIGIGDTALGSVSVGAMTGSYNNAFGSDVMRSCEAGDENAGFGDSTLYSLIDGNYNAVFGASAALNLTNGDANAIFGAYSANILTTASNCIIIGDTIDGLSATLDAQIVIGTSISGYQQAIADVDVSGLELAITGPSALPAAATNQDGGDLRLRGGQKATGGGTSDDTIAEALVITDKTDNTKEVDWDLSSITTANRRTITMPDSDIDLGSLGGGGMTVVATKTGAYTASANEVVPVDSSGGSFTITFPASPGTEDRIIVIDVGKNCTSAPVTIARNGNTIDGAAEDFIIDQDHGRVDAIFDGTSDWETHLIGAYFIGNGYEAINAQTGTTYDFVAQDLVDLVTANNASASTYNITDGFGAVGKALELLNIGAGEVTITVAGSDTLGSSNNKCATGNNIKIVKTGATTWWVMGGTA